MRQLISKKLGKVGNSIILCVHLDWTLYNLSRHFSNAPTPDFVHNIFVHNGF